MIFDCITITAEMPLDAYRIQVTKLANVKLLWICGKFGVTTLTFLSMSTWTHCHSTVVHMQLHVTTSCLPTAAITMTMLKINCLAHCIIMNHLAACDNETYWNFFFVRQWTVSQWGALDSVCLKLRSKVLGWVSESCWKLWCLSGC